MSPSNLPVELFERILEDLDIPDILHLKFLDRQAYLVICCSNRVKYRIELFLAGLEDGNYYSLAERQQFLRSYQSNWDSLTPQKTTRFPIPIHRIYELAGGVFGVVPHSAHNSLRFYRLPSVSRAIEMEEWAIEDLDFSIDDFTMEPASDLLIPLAYKTGNVKVHLLKLSDGKPHPRAREPLLEYDIPLIPTVVGWGVEVIIWENRFGCLFTSISNGAIVDCLVIWDWTTGNLVRVFAGYGSTSFIFLNRSTIVIGRFRDSRSSLSFFNLDSMKNPTCPFLMLGFPDGYVKKSTLRRIRMCLDLPIRHGPELGVRVPFVINRSHQMLFILVFTVDSNGTTSKLLSIAVPISALQGWAHKESPFVEWKHWGNITVPTILRNTQRATFTAGSRFVIPQIADFPETGAGAEAQLTHDPIAAAVYNLSPRRLMRVLWDPSEKHCQGITGVWNTVKPIDDNGSYLRATRTHAEQLVDIFMTEDSLVAVDVDSRGEPELSLVVLSF